MEEVRFRIDSAERGVFVALVSGERSDQDEGGLRESAAYNELEEISQELARCEISHRLYGRGDQVRLDLRAAFVDVEDVNSKLSCGAQQWEEPLIGFERRNGMFSDTYTTIFSVRIEAGPCTEMCETPLNEFPHLLTLSVPGRVSEIADRSDILGAAIRSERVDNDTVRIRIDAVPNYREVSRQYFAVRNIQSRKDRLRIEVTSEEVHYNLNTIISILGLVFGSGLAIEIGRRLFRRRSGKSEPISD